MKRGKSRAYTSRKKAFSYNHVFTGFLAVSLGVIGVLAVTTITLSTMQSTRVLGAHMLLARGGDDTGSGGSGGSEQDLQTNSGSQGDQQTSDGQGPMHGMPGRPPKPHMPPGLSGSRSGKMGFFIHEDHMGSDEGEMPELEHHADGDLLRVGSMSARSHFPIMITASGEAVVVTPHGTIVAVLPDKALQALLKTHILSHIDEGSSSAELVEKNEIAVFEVHGSTRQKLFGFIPVNIHKTVDVSAQTGETISENEGLGARILDLFSF